MSGPQSSGDDKDNAVAKTAGFVVFSGIAMSILKALSPFNKPRTESEPQQPLAHLTQPIHTPPEEPPIVIKKQVTCISETVVKPNIVPKAPDSQRKVEIIKGDTLWGLSRKYGVTIDAIKEANGLSNDKIYAGKKLIIPE